MVISDFKWIPTNTIRTKINILCPEENAWMKFIVDYYTLKQIYNDNFVNFKIYIISLTLFSLF